MMTHLKGTLYCFLNRSTKDPLLESSSSNNSLAILAPKQIHRDRPAGSHFVFLSSSHSLSPVIQQPKSFSKPSFPMSARKISGLGNKPELINHITDINLQQHFPNTSSLFLTAYAPCFFPFHLPKGFAQGC